MAFGALSARRQLLAESLVLVTKLLVLAPYVYLAAHAKFAVHPYGSFWIAGIVGFLISVSMAVLLLQGTRALRLAIFFPAVLLDLAALLAALTAAYYRYGGDSGEIPKIANHIDALYFATTVITTTGFGDILAVGSHAKLLVTCQMLFDFVYLGTVITLAITMLVQRGKPSDAERTT
jgi:Ion channel